MGIATNLIALVLLVVVFELIKYKVIIGKIPGLFMIGVALIVVIASFIYAFGLTGAWKLSHQRIKNLDERQIQVVLHSIRISYSIFVIIVLLVIYAFAILEKGPVDVVLAAAMLYLANILPASILAWTEKEL
jgi:hypothetical protein